MNIITEERLRIINEKRRRNGKPSLTMSQVKAQSRGYTSSSIASNTFDDFLIDCAIVAQSWSSSSYDSGSISSSSSSYDYSSSSSYDSGSSSFSSSD